MKIDKTINPLPTKPAGEGRVTTPPKGDSTPSSRQAESTSVSLGSTATQLRGMEGMSSTPTVNTAKVAEIRQAISEGRFKVNSDAIADGLIATVRELIGERT